MVPHKPIIDVRSTVIEGQKPVRPNTTAAQTTQGQTTQAQPIATTTTGNQGANQSTSSTRSKTQLSTTVPDEFKGSTNQELIDYLQRKVNGYKPLSDEDLDKIRKRQKAEGMISGVSDVVRAISNMAFTNKYAPNMYDPSTSMSAKAKARFEKEKADRDAEDDRYYNYAMMLAKLRGDDQDRGLKIWQTEQNLAREDRAYDAGRQDRADDVAFRNKDYDERVRQWQANFDRQDKWHEEEAQRWERQFKESIRQFNVTSSLERQRINISAQQLAHSMKQGQMTFNLGSGNGNVTLSLDKLNAQTVSRIFHTLPQAARDQVKGDPIVQNGFVVGYEPPTTEAMLIAIGANVESSPATQNAIKQVAGLETGKKPAGY